jgi:hypothetical protein
MAQVQLAVYDLSQGMARGLSAQFLGPDHAIEIIPHTAIVVFGQEYFFGGGIQAVPPQQFRASRNMHPIQTLALGTTTVSKADFDNWCFQQTQSGLYSVQAYDLLHRNCNNFSHDAALQGLRLSAGVPDWILGVPQRFLSSPMGQMMRPMLEQMQMTGTAPVGGNSGGATTFGPTATSTTPPVPSTDVNPWANLPAQSTASTTPSTTTTTTATTATTTTITTTDVLDKYTNTFLSNDSKSVPMCIAKLVLAVETKEKKIVLEQLGTALIQQPTPTALDDVLATAALEILLEMLQQKDGASSSSTILTFALMMLRLIVLARGVPAALKMPTLEWIATQLTLKEEDETLRIRSVPAKSMAWCVWSNALAVHGFADWMMQGESSATMESLTQSAIRDLQHARVELRQAASCFLYNYHTTVTMSLPKSNIPDELDDATVSLLCAMLESVDRESDETTQLRRLLVVGRILQQHPHKAAAKNLIRDLGFVETLQEIITTTSSSPTTQAGPVAGALVGLVKNSASP